MALNKDKVLDSARKYAEKGQIDKAIKEYQRVLEEDPKDVRVWLKLGDLYAKRGSKTEAVEAYERVAKSYEDQGFFLKAVAVYKQILKLDPGLININRRLGDLYRQLGLLTEAMQHYEAVSTQLQRDGKGRQALEIAKQLVELDVENVATRIKLAELYSKEEFVDDAVREFEIACEQLRKQNRVDDFIKVAERLLWHRPEMNDLSRELATLYMRRKDARRALTKLQACFKADPRDVVVLNMLADAFAELEQGGKAVQVLKELARIHDQSGQKENALDAYRRLLQLEPGDADANAYVNAQKAPNRPPAPPPPAAGGRIQFTPKPEMAPPSLNKTGAESLLKDKRLVPEFGAPDYEQTGATGQTGSTLGGSPQQRPDARAATASRQIAVPDMPAGAETHAAQISKLLSETDVYIKYQLYPKAVEHLRKIFSLDSENVEGRERLKIVYLAQGREDDAMAELMRLAELHVAQDPERAEGYLRELLGIDGAYQPALDLARRYRLDLAMAPEVEIDDGDAVSFDPDEIPSATFDPVTEDIGFDEVYSDDLGSREGMAKRISTTVVPGSGRRPLSAAEIESRIDSQLELDSELELPPVDTNVDRFDRHAARAFDADIRQAAPARAASNVATSPGRSAAPPVAQSRPFATEAATGTYDQAALARTGGALDEELEEAEFYFSQGMLDDAREIYRRLLAQHPGHPLVQAKLAELGDGDDFGGMPQGSPHPGPPPSAPRPAIPSVGVNTPRGPIPPFPAKGAGKPGGAGPTSPPSLAGAAAGAGARKPMVTDSPKPSVMLERPLEDHDLDTQYDLGLAYKEMGLFDDAISSFQKVLASNYRLAECVLMLGVCLRLQGQHRRAIDQLTRGLREQITDSERISLLYELGVTYQELGELETADALFADLEAQSPGFADVTARRRQIRGESSGGTGARKSVRASTEDAESALDSLFSDD